MSRKGRIVAMSLAIYLLLWCVVWYFGNSSVILTFNNRILRRQETGGATTAVPVIGIVTRTLKRDPRWAFVESNYVNFIQMAGAQVVPIIGDQPFEYYEKMFSYINGILLPGGIDSLESSAYAKTGRLLYKMAVEANDAGDLIPIFGICNGFELIASIVAKRNIRQRCSAKDYYLPLEFRNDVKDSKLFVDASENIMHILEEANVTANFHEHCLTVEEYNNDARLNSFLRVLSVNKDRDGLDFVSTFEAYNYPIYGVQFHPEKTMYEMRPNTSIVHTYLAIQVGRFFADFFIDEARKSTHTFPDPLTLSRLTADNCKSFLHSRIRGHNRVLYLFDKSSNPLENL